MKLQEEDKCTIYLKAMSQKEFSDRKKQKGTKNYLLFVFSLDLFSLSITKKKKK